VARKGLIDQSGIMSKANELAKLFNSFGSDKSKNHSYQFPYAAILSDCPSGGLLEIGIGSIKETIESNMSWFKGAIPGGSLRAWRSTKKFKVVIGADIDRDSLFTEPGISTFWVDQLNSDSLIQLRTEAIGLDASGYSLVIDDGLHTAEANICTFQALYSLVKSGGYYVIEDIAPEDLHQILNHLAPLLPQVNWQLWHGSKGGTHRSMLTIQKLTI
jgi:cephalosporin hydroxylase